MDNPLPPPPVDVDSPMSVLDIVTAGGLSLTVLIGILFFLLRLMKSSARKKERAYKPLAAPLYTGVSGAPRIFPGWYPTANGDQDRYHDGLAWTSHFRPHTEASRLGDEPPPGVTVNKPEPLKVEEPDE